ncbi:SRPBCC family protein [Kribbella sp. NPDC049584]|uniref:SRPBCC family protein n=1 Tax=Kribbella sp. NPDC049584 TaxID=3154833 RepID=UPI0034185B95
MINIEESTIINRPAPDVFAFVGDQTNAPRWQRGLASVRRLGVGPIEVGTKHEFVRTMMGRRMSGENEYTHFEPDRYVAFTATSGGWPLEASYEVEPAGEHATRLVSRIALQPSGAFRVLQPLFAAAMRRDVRANLGTLKALLEANDGRQSPSA